MPLRRTDTDPEREEAVATARTALADALDHLATMARIEAKVAARKTGRPGLPAVYAASRAVERAEEALDLAAYDLSTASGEDG